jgi:hypothetical protein
MNAMQTTTSSRSQGGPDVTVGSGKHSYAVIPDWAKLPDGMSLARVAGVAVDPQDRSAGFVGIPLGSVIANSSGQVLTQY